MVDCFGLQPMIYNAETPLSRPRKNEESEIDCFGLQGTIYNTESPLSRPRKNEEWERLELSKGFWRQKLQLISPIHNYSGDYINRNSLHPRQSRSFIHSYAALNCRSHYNPRSLRFCEDCQQNLVIRMTFLQDEAI